MSKTKIPNYPMINPVPIVLVGANVGGKPNFAAVGAFGAVCLEPLFYASLKDTHHTTAGIRETGWFSVNMPTGDMVAQTDYCGMVSGADTDKSRLFECFSSKAGNAPMISECPVNFLCKVVDTHSIGGFTVFFGEITETYASDNCMTDSQPDPEKIVPIIGMGMTYYGLGEPVGKVFSEGKTLIAMI